MSLTSYNKFLIISGYYEGESYGLLGPQMAATIIEKYAGVKCIVVGVCREFDKALLKKEIYKFFQNERPIVGFSTLLGREELFMLAKELKEEGVLTILAGPQCHVDYLGEKGWKDFPYRFKGFWDCFDFAIQGPCEQIIPFFKSFSNTKDISGVAIRDKDGFIKNVPSKWNDRFLSHVKWDNLFIFYKNLLKRGNITCVQLLHQIGCPYATIKKKIFIDYPIFFDVSEQIPLEIMGCSFCDVAVDKGFCGKVSDGAIVSQLMDIPEDEEGRKIPFEIINENPIPFLPYLLNIADNMNIRLSQINLTLRADWFVKNYSTLDRVLKRCQRESIRILISSIGFESFDDTILLNLNKGVDVNTNLNCVKLLREVKERYPDVFFYSREDGAIHGFIHPTPWDNEVTRANNQKRIFAYNLFKDILPYHSTPLIIHHASFLGDWIRKIEEREKVIFSRGGNIIHWWEYKNV